MAQVAQIKGAYSSQSFVTRPSKQRKENIRWKKVLEKQKGEYPMKMKKRTHAAQCFGSTSLRVSRKENGRKKKCDKWPVENFTGRRYVVYDISLRGDDGQ